MLRPKFSARLLLTVPTSADYYFKLQRRIEDIVESD
jgi:hypothetical protein